MISSISNSSSPLSSLGSSSSNSLATAMQGESAPTKESIFSALNAAANEAGHNPEIQENDEVRKQFNKFVGGTFFRQMLTEMQKSVGKPAYMHGGQGEEMFRKELNSKLADQMAESSGDQFAGPMFELFQLHRQN